MRESLLKFIKEGLKGVITFFKMFTSNGVDLSAFECIEFVAYLLKLEEENKDLQNRLDMAQGFLDRDLEYQEMKAQTEWQQGEPEKGKEIFARNNRNCNLIATYFDGAWRNSWNGGKIDFKNITMWRYTGF